jgi:ketosteroid isomerase-like protein
MSQENVEVVRRAFEAWNAGGPHAARELFAPDAIMRLLDTWPEPGPFVGRKTILRQLDQMRRTWDADTLELIGAFVDVGDRVAVRQIWRGIGRGPEASVETTVVYTVRRGKIFNVEHFWDHAEALETLGLSEQTLMPTPEPAGYFAGDVAGECELHERGVSGLRWRRPDCSRRTSRPRRRVESGQRPGAEAGFQGVLDISPSSSPLIVPRPCTRESTSTRWSSSSSLHIGPTGGRVSLGLNHAELSHLREDVDDSPGLGDSAVCEADNEDLVVGDGFAR